MERERDESGRLPNHCLWIFPSSLPRYFLGAWRRERRFNFLFPSSVIFPHTGVRKRAFLSFHSHRMPRRRFPLRFLLLPFFPSSEIWFLPLSLISSIHSSSSFPARETPNFTFFSFRPSWHNEQGEEKGEEEKLSPWPCLGLGLGLGLGCMMGPFSSWCFFCLSRCGRRKEE